MSDAPESAESSVRSFTSAGELLRQARESRKFTLNTAAQELHLDVWMLEALENNNFKALGAPVFAKGHLRKYAHWLGLAPDDVLVAYYRDKGAPETPPLVVSQVSRHTSRDPGSWRRFGIAAAIIAAIAAAAFLWINPPTERPESVRIDAADETTLAVPLPRPAVSSGQLEAETVPAASVVDPATEALPPGSGELLLVFNEASWADVRDRDGNRWFESIMPEGSVETLVGRFPFTVFLGNAGGVYIAVSGQQFDIAPDDLRRNGTARFTIDDPAAAGR